MLFRKKKLDDVIYYQQLFASVEGKIVLADLIKKNFVLSNTFNEDPYKSAFNQGKRDAINEIISILNVDVDEVVEMLKRDKERSEKYQQGE